MLNFFFKNKERYYTYSLVNTNLLYANFNNTQFEKDPMYYEISIKRKYEIRLLIIL